MTRSLPFLAIIALLAACQGIDPGADGATGSTGMSITVGGDDSAPSGEPRFSDDRGVEYHLTEARFALRDIELYLPAGVRCADIADELAGGARCESSDDSSRSGGSDDTQPDDNGGDRVDGSVDDNPHPEGEDKIVIDGPFVVDLVAGTATPGLSAVRVPALDYRRIDFRVDEAESRDGLLAAGDELDGRSFVARSEFTYMDVALELVVRLRFSEDIRIETSGGVAAGPNLVVEFDAGAWLDGIDLGACLDDGDLAVEDGRIVVDDDASSGCSDIENRIKDNLKDSGRLVWRG